MIKKVNYFYLLTQFSTKKERKLWRMTFMMEK